MNIVGSGTVNGKIYGSATLGTLAPTTSGGIEIDLLNGGDSSSAFTGAETATVQLVIRKDTAANWNTNNPVLADGEIGFITDDQQFFVGDGVTAYQDLQNAHYIVHWDEFINISDGINTSISTINTAIEGLNSSLSGVQQGINDVVSDIVNIQSDISSLQTSASSLQGQIDTINTSVSSGLPIKLELNLSASDIIPVDGIIVDIITPSADKIIVPISAMIVYLSGSSQTNGEVRCQLMAGSTEVIFNERSVFDNGEQKSKLLAINQTNVDGLGINQPLSAKFTIGSSIEGSDGTFKLVIFYMEV